MQEMTHVTKYSHHRDFDHMKKVSSYKVINNCNSPVKFHSVQTNREEKRRNTHHSRKMFFANEVIFCIIWMWNDVVDSFISANYRVLNGDKKVLFRTFVRALNTCVCVWVLLSKCVDAHVSCIWLRQFFAILIGVYTVPVPFCVWDQIWHEAPLIQPSRHQIIFIRLYFVLISI